jgi:hypothetical protein
MTRYWFYSWYCWLTCLSRSFQDLKGMRLINTFLVFKDSKFSLSWSEGYDFCLFIESDELNSLITLHLCRILFSKLLLYPSSDTLISCFKTSILCSISHLSLPVLQFQLRFSSFIIIMYVFPLSKEKNFIFFLSQFMALKIKISYITKDF